MKNGAVDGGFAALADPQRRRVIELLSERPHRAGELAVAIKVSAPAMSRHLKALKESGMIEETHPQFDARVRIYSLRSEGMAPLKLWLEKADSLWARQLLSFKDHLENDGR